MSVPAPNVKPLQIPHGVAHYSFVGEIGTTGPSLIIDLTDIPERLRKDPGFRDQLYIFIQVLSSSAGIDIDATSVAVLPAAPALPEYVSLTASATDATGEIQILVETHHSIGR